MIKSLKNLKKKQQQNLANKILVLVGPEQLNIDLYNL